MKNFPALFILCLCLSVYSTAQTVIQAPVDELAEPVKPVKLILGLEGGFGVHNIKGPGLINTGLTVEVPWKKFSFGTGIMLKKMGTQKYKTYTGYSYTTIKNDTKITRYEYDRHKVDLSYISIPLRVQMRLPCNCMYIQGGVEIDFLKKDADQNYETVQYEEEPDKYMEENIVKDVNYTFVVGMGFKLHESRRLRIFMRPEYEFMLNHIKESSSYHKHNTLNRLKMTMGVQYGI